MVALDTSGTVLFSNEAGALSCVETERLFDRFFTVEAEYKNKKLLVRVSLKKNT